MAAGAAAAGFSTHALAVFAAARCMAADGNRIGLVPPDRGERIDGFHITTGSTETGSPERVAVLVHRFDRFDWPRGRGVEVAATRAATIDALIASQGRINVRRPGMVVLSVGLGAPRARSAARRGHRLGPCTTVGAEHRGLVGGGAGDAQDLPRPRDPTRWCSAGPSSRVANPHYGHGAGRRESGMPHRGAGLNRRRLDRAHATGWSTPCRLSCHGPHLAGRPS